MSEVIEFVADNDRLLLKYSALEVAVWLPERFKTASQYHLRRTFKLTPKEQVVDFEESDEFEYDVDSPVYFVIANVAGEYYQFDKNILGIDYELLIHIEVDLDQKMFTAVRNTSIFSNIGKLKIPRFVIGGDMEESIPDVDFRKFIEKFPNQYELDKYVRARVGSVLKDYVQAHTKPKRPTIVT